MIKDFVSVDYDDVLGRFRINEKDTGSSAVQVILLTRRIVPLSKHLQKFKKDFHSLRGLIKMLNTRRSLLKYIKIRDVKQYQNLIKSLNIRK
ncbi:30S ribosomal protein S15 [Anaplasmataceae bacterium AB001_6]|nr:30S ribosomal protein S15 [Anaplasmataceae bacterium AB001_6]